MRPGARSRVRRAAGSTRPGDGAARDVAAGDGAIGEARGLGRRHGPGRRRGPGTSAAGEVRGPGWHAAREAWPRRERVGEGGRGRGEGGKLTSGLDDRGNRPPDHLGQRRWKRGGREGEKVAARVSHPVLEGKPNANHVRARISNSCTQQLHN
jgi:hypothetical protein